MDIHFVKMHALGNDFMVLNNTKPMMQLTKERIKLLADRHIGIGFDQMIVLESADYATSKFFYRIYNADGNEVYQCGNGARCVAKYLIDNSLCAQNKLWLTTAKATYEVLVEEDTILVNMGMPTLDPAFIPYSSQKKEYPLLNEVVEKGSPYTFGTCALGNPHAVIIVDDLDNFPVDEYGQKLNQDSRFPDGVNVEFMTIDDQHNIKLRVYERGVGETLACGSGSCAAVVIGRLQGKLGSHVTVRQAKGELEVLWQDQSSSVMLKGGANTVFAGKLDMTFIKKNFS